MREEAFKTKTTIEFGSKKLKMKQFLVKCSVSTRIQFKINHYPDINEFLRRKLLEIYDKIEESMRVSLIPNI